MVKVVKKDKSLQDYKESKVVKSCKGAGMPEPIAKAVGKMISQKVKSKSSVKSSEIKVMIMSIVKKVSKVPANWKNFKKPSKKKKK